MFHRCRDGGMPLMTDGVCAGQLVQHLVGQRVKVR